MMVNVKWIRQGYELNQWVLKGFSLDEVQVLSIYIYSYERPRIQENVSIEHGTVIGTPTKPLHSILIGSGTRIFGGMICPRSFYCGQQVTIHKDAFIYGRSDCTIGHNSWFGMRCTLDCEGEFSVGNNFGAGQDTHLWSHIAHGDTLQGCSFYDFRSFTAEDDVWFVGRCTSAPAYHYEFSIALTESNVTRDMQSHRVYCGNPAKPIDGRGGYTFSSDKDKEERLVNIYSKYASISVKEAEPLIQDYFDVKDRTYNQDKFEEFDSFFYYLLREQKMKFVPRNWRSVQHGKSTYNTGIL